MKDDDSTTANVSLLQSNGFRASKIPCEANRLQHRQAQGLQHPSLRLLVSERYDLCEMSPLANFGVADSTRTLHELCQVLPG